jgi:hypothetical protein
VKKDNYLINIWEKSDSEAIADRIRGGALSRDEPGERALLFFRGTLFVISGLPCVFACEIQLLLLAEVFSVRIQTD